MRGTQKHSLKNTKPSSWSSSRKSLWATRCLLRAWWARDKKKSTYAPRKGIDPVGTVFFFGGFPFFFFVWWFKGKPTLKKHRFPLFLWGFQGEANMKTKHNSILGFSP